MGDGIFMQNKIERVTKLLNRQDVRKYEDKECREFQDLR